MRPYEPSAFERYYDVFLQNSLRGRRYRITLGSGESLEGVPMSSSIADPRDPKVSFLFKADNERTYQIPFSFLQTADPAGMLVAVIRTVDVDTLAGGDLLVHIAADEAEKLQLADDLTTTSIVLSSRDDFQDQLPGFYKYLTVQGRHFQIKKIERVRGSQMDLRLVVDPT